MKTGDWQEKVAWEQPEALKSALALCADAYAHIELKPSTVKPADTTQNPAPPAVSDHPGSVGARPMDNQVRGQSTEVDPDGHVLTLKLQNRTANHSGADALVYIPPNFDPSRPIKMMVYNHGLSNDVSTAFANSRLKAQMDAGDPNTILVMPEWQTSPDTRDSASGKMPNRGFFANMLEEIIEKTPQLQGKSLDDVKGISVFTHSGGYNAAMSEIYNNGLQDRIDEVTLLDSLYNGTGFDRWIHDNIYDLASGKKHFYNFFGGSTNDNSHALAQRVGAMLRSAHLPQSAMVEDYANSGRVMRSDDIARAGIIFKRSDVSLNGLGSHNSLTVIYPGQVLQADQRIASNS